MLRPWQADCVELALEKYLSGQSHFQVRGHSRGRKNSSHQQEIAKKLYDLDKIDLVLCFSSLTIAGKLKIPFPGVWIALLVG